MCAASFSFLCVPLSFSSPRGCCSRKLQWQCAVTVTENVGFAMFLPRCTRWGSAPESEKSSPYVRQPELDQLLGYRAIVSTVS